MSSAISAGGCSIADLACQCGPSDAAIGSIAAPCLLSACVFSDISRAQSAGASVCSAYSATVGTGTPLRTSTSNKGSTAPTPSSSRSLPASTTSSRAGQSSGDVFSDGTSTSGTASDTSGLSNGAKTGIGVGVAIAAIIISVLSFLLWRAKKKAKAEEPTPTPTATGKAELPSEGIPVYKAETVQHHDQDNGPYEMYGDYGTRAHNPHLTHELDNDAATKGNPPEEIHGNPIHEIDANLRPSSV